MASFSGNDLYVLRRLPELNENYLMFSCRHCALAEIESGVFINTPKILRLDLSYNKLTADSLHSDIFRGRFNVASYEPILLEELDLGNNLIWQLDPFVFEHLPNLRTLSLANNHLTNLEITFTHALAPLVNLEHLDLSQTAIYDLPEGVFADKPHLRELLIYGNDFKELPTSVQKIGDSLKSLYIGGNPIEYLNATSFEGLHHLAQLNISNLWQLQSIAEDTFVHLDSLEVLFGRGNTKLREFNITQLQHLSKLREVDLSHCDLAALTYYDPDGTAYQTEQFPKLRSLKLEGNSWHCDCELYETLRILEHHGSHQFQSDDDARCRSPVDMAGVPLVDFFMVPHCQELEQMKKAPRMPSYQEPAFLRPRSIFLSLAAVLVVIVLGLVVGFGIVLVKRRWKRGDLGFEAPVKYSTVRSSVSSVTTTTLTTSA